MKLRKYLNENEEVLVVSYEGADEKKLDKLLKKHKAKVKDWSERDYGLLLFIDIPNSQIRSFKSKIDSMKDYSWTER